MEKKRRIGKVILILSCIVIALLCWLIVTQLMEQGESVLEDTPQQSTQTQPTTVATEPPTSEDTQATTEPEPTEPQMIPELAELFEQNPDIAGWIKIENTVVDYPVMYTPDEPEKYLRRDFNGDDSRGGVPFLEDACSLEPESDNLIIYGHNMKNGTMFRTLMSYVDEEFWMEHPQVQYSTLYETRTYDILAVFYDRVYYKYEDVFKFYQFIDAVDEEDYRNAIAYYKENALYDTGVTAEYGDRLLTLVTCSYHEDNGRFVLVARQRTELTD